MQPDARGLLWDALEAAKLITSFLDDATWEIYAGDALLRSGVERQFEIIGEALNRLSKVDGKVAAEVPDLARIVGFRNVLIHGYAVVDDSIVWSLATTRLPLLLQTLARLLPTGDD